MNTSDWIAVLIGAALALIAVACMGNVAFPL